MHVYLRGDWLQRLRLASGLVLFAFAATHFLNHALGLVGLEAMHQAQALRTAVTRSWPGSAVLGAALVVHIALGLHKLGQRRTWRMPVWEAVQIALGLAIPFLLLPHIINTRIAHTFFDVQDSYLYELVRLWPDSAIVQSALLLLVWAHGCVGLHYWLRLSEPYRRIAPALLPIAVAVPVLALAGFAVSGRVTGDIMSDAQALASLKARSHWPNPADSATLAWLRDLARMGSAAMLAAIVTIAVLRRRKVTAAEPSPATITYLDGPTVPLFPGATLLEVSRAAGVPHASVCGGRARCSTCRVRIDSGLETLAPPAPVEAVTLRAIEAPRGVRLACQVRPSASLTIAIISPPATPGPIRVEFVEIKEVVAAHARAILSGQLVDVGSADMDEISAWLRDKTTDLRTIPDLGPHGFELIGARLDYLLDRPAAALVYTRHARPVTLFTLPSRGSDALAIRGQRNGYRVRAWAMGELAYFAATDLPSTELERLEECLSRAEAA